MGDSFTHEFSMGGVPTGRSLPDQTIQIPNAGAGGIPAMSTQTIPGAPIMRPSFLQAFLSNLGPALAGGLAPAEGHPFGTGLGGAFQGMQSQNERNRQYGLEAQAQQRANREAASTQAVQASQIAAQQQQMQQQQQLFPGQLQEQQMNLQMRKGIVDLASNPDSVKQLTGAMTSSLGKISPDEQAQLDAANGVFQSNLKQGKFDPTPIQGAVTKISQDRLEAKKSAQNPEQQEMADYLSKNSGKGPADFMAYKAKLVPNYQFFLQNSIPGIPGGGAAPGGAAGAAAAPDISKVPAGLQGTVKSILEYRQALPPMGRNNPTNKAIQYWVNAIDPTYDATTFPARNKILTEYVKDASTGQLGAINTSLGHLGELYQANQAVDRGDIPLLNSIANKVGAATGSDAPTIYNMILHRVGPEMTSAYIKGGGTEGERGANEADFGLNKGMQQRTSNIEYSAKLLRSKLASKEQDWNQTFRPATPAQSFENRFLTPDAKATLDMLSNQAGSNKKGNVINYKIVNGELVPQ